MMMEPRDILLHIVHPDGREAYVERVGRAYVVGGELPADAALVELAKVSVRRAAMIEEHAERGDDGA